MLWVCRSETGALQAACDWWLVDEAGHWTPEGRYVFLHELEVSPGVNLHTLRQQMVKDISQQAPQALGVFWKRAHDVFPRVHAFRREQLQQLREEVRV